MQGANTCRVLLLLSACVWLVGCAAPPTATPTPLRIEVPVKVPVEVTRLVTRHITQQVIAAATPTPAVPCAASQPAESAVVTIGAILPLSSPGAILAGFAMQTAINIAVTDINEKGGIQGVPIRLVTYDSAGTPERSAQFAERLILLDCVVAIVGLYHNGDAMAVTDVAHRYGIPVIVAEAGADDITARGYPEVFRIAPAHSMLGQVPALWLSAIGDYNHDGVTIAAIIAENSNSRSALLDAVQSSMVEAGIETEVLRVDLPSTDFSSVIARLVAQEKLPDALFIYIKGQPALLLQAELLAAGIGPQRSTLIVQNYAGLDSPHFWNEVPGGVGTIVTRMGAWSSTVTARGQEFVLKYDQYAGKWPEPYAFAAFDAICLLAEVMDKAPSWRGSDLVAALEATDQEFSSGHIRFADSSITSDAATPTTYLWHQWADSQILYLQYTEAEQPADAMVIVWPPQYRAMGVQTSIAPATP